jgi:hypothetical protein
MKDKKKLTHPEIPLRSSPAAQPMPDAAVPALETARLEAAGPPPSVTPSMPTDPPTPAAGVPLPAESDRVAPPPDAARSWWDQFIVRSGIVGTVFTIVGTVVTIASVGLAVYFYEASQVKPRLTFGVHPLKTELQRPDYDKDLGFIYGGKPIESESITSVQVSIWNAGTRSIRENDILDPIRIVMPDGSAILSARVKKTSRPICGFERLDDAEDFKSGKCRLKWRILEPGDGGVLQIVYAGSARHDPILEGAIEGQREGIVVETYHFLSDKTTMTPQSMSMVGGGGFLILFVIAVSLFVVGIRIKANTPTARHEAEVMAAAAKQLAELRKKPVAMPPVAWVLIAGAFACFLGAVALLFSGISTAGPPFGW